MEASAELGRLVESYRPAIQAQCARWTGNEEDARELCQDAMEAAMRRLGTFRGEAKFRTWIFGIAFNLCRNHRRKLRDTLTKDGLLVKVDSAEGVHTELSRHQREQLVREVRASALTPEEARVFYLRYELQLSLDEITELMGLECKSGARKFIQRCKPRLRRALLERLEELGHGTSYIREGP